MQEVIIDSGRIFQQDSNGNVREKKNGVLEEKVIPRQVFQNYVKYAGSDVKTLKESHKTHPNFTDAMHDFHNTK